MTHARILARTLSEDDLNRILQQLGGGRGQGDRPGGLTRFGPLHDRIRTREDHLFNTDAVNPRFSAPHSGAEPRQTDLPRRTWSQLRQRLTEHPLRVHVEPPNQSSAARRAADDLEHVFEHGLRLAQERSGIDIQAELGYGQACLCFGVLHWQRALDRLPAYPPAETRVSQPDDPRERRRFRRSRPEDQTQAAWIETAESRRRRDRRAQADAGFPWEIEVVRPDQFAFVEDRGADNGLGLAVVLRELALFDYRDRVRRQDGIELRLQQLGGEPALAIGQGEEAPQIDEPSGAGWGERIRVASVWTRREYYELAAPGSGSAGSDERWLLIKSHPHPYEMPPFALAEADVNDHPDPQRRWEPAMEGIYRVKPKYDYERSLGRFLAEQTAIPLYWVQLADGNWQTDAGGKRIELNPNSAAAQVLPAGASLHRVEFGIDPAFVEFLRMSADELFAAAPDAGAVERGEIDPNTQPHTLNLLLGSRNLQVQQLKRNQARAVRVMLRNMALVMSKPLAEGGFGGPIWSWAKSADGRVRRSETIGVPPERIAELDIDVWIDPYSTAQRIAVQEHGRARLNDPLDPLDQRAYLEQYIGDEHAVETLARHRAWRREQAELERELGEAGAVDGTKQHSRGTSMKPNLAPLGRLTDPADDRSPHP